MVREIIVWGNQFYSLYNQLDIKAKKKIDYVFWLIRYTERVPIRFLKYLQDTDGLYEIRVNTTFNEIRILCFFDESKLVVVVNSFFKKSRKTPKQEIEIGERLKNDYFDSKNRRK